MRCLHGPGFRETYGVLSAAARKQLLGMRPEDAVRLRASNAQGAKDARAGGVMLAILLVGGGIAAIAIANSGGSSPSRTTPSGTPAASTTTERDHGAGWRESTAEELNRIFRHRESREVNASAGGPDAKYLTFDFATCNKPELEALARKIGPEGLREAGFTRLLCARNPAEVEVP